MTPREPTRLHLFVSDAEDFINGKHNWCFHVAASKEMFDNNSRWVYVCALNIDFEKYLSLDSMRQQALDNLAKDLERERAAFTTLQKDIENRRQNLLAITHNPEPDHA